MSQSSSRMPSPGGVGMKYYNKGYSSALKKWIPITILGTGAVTALASTLAYNRYLKYQFDKDQERTKGFVTSMNGTRQSFSGTGANYVATGKVEKGIDYLEKGTTETK